MKKFFSKKTLSSFVNNKFLTSTKKPIQLYCRVTKKPFYKLSPINPKDIPLAIRGAEITFSTYKNTSASDRSKLLKKTFNLLIAYKDTIAKIIVSEMGKTITEASAEVVYSASYFEHYSELLLKPVKNTIPSKDPHKKLYAYQVPVGVCGFITPWNFPLAMPSRKIAAALATGCTCLIKPSPETPITTLFLAELLKKAGFPSGACQVLIGEEKTIGKKLFSSPIIKKFSFTGSTNTGKYLYKECSPTLKKLSLELGGLAPFIVFEDADIEKAASEAVLAKFRNSGQACVAASTFLIHKKVFSAFSKLFAEKVQNLRIGDPFCHSTQFSSYLHTLSEKKAKKHLKDALEKKAKTLLPTKDPSHPQILINCKRSMIIFEEETFSPIAPLYSFSSEEEAITLANDSPFGLAAYVFTENLTKAQRVIEQLNFGMIGFNDGVFSSAQLPFGGVKESGFGREGGPHGLNDFFVSKAVSHKVK